MKRIVLDMDEVLTDFCKKDLEVYNNVFHKSVKREDLYAMTLDEFDPSSKEIMDILRATPDYFLDLEVKEGSQDGVQRLMSKYEVFIATAAMEWPKSFTAKYQWLRNNFPFVPDTQYVLCGDKSILHADYMIDDSLRNILAFSGEGYIFEAHHNQEVKFDKIFHNWNEVMKFFKV